MKTRAIKLHFEIPTVPNFIRVQYGIDGTAVVPISGVDAASLRRIGVEWTRALVRRARSRRLARK